MTTYYAAIKWPVDATKADIRQTLQNDLELLILTLVEEKGFDADDLRDLFEDAFDNVAADLEDTDD